MKINIKDVLKNDTEKADLHSEHWLTDAMEAEEKSAPEESESAEMPDTDSDPGVEAFESEMPDTDSEEEIPEAEELAEELTEGILSEPEPEAVSAETPVEPELRHPSRHRRSRICGHRCNSRRSRQNLQHSRKRRLQRRWPQRRHGNVDAPVAEKTPEHSTAEPAEPPKTEAQDGEIPAVAETEAEQLCRKKRNIPLRNLAGRMGWQRRSHCCCL